VVVGVAVGAALGAVGGSDGVVVGRAIAGVAVGDRLLVFTAFGVQLPQSHNADPVMYKASSQGQFLNASNPILVTDAGILTDDKLVCTNERIPMLVTELCMLIDDRLVQKEKA
jgi:hypothetical protein